MPPIQISSQHVRILAGLSLLLLALTALVLWYESEGARPWKKYQRAFAALDREISTRERTVAVQQADSPEKTEQLALLDRRLKGIAERPLAIRQVWLPELGVTDRCASCHLGAELSRFQDAPQPLTSHSGKHLATDRHPVERFGCVSCHAGQGVALEAGEAHGRGHNWVEPFLPGARAEAACVTCHPLDGRAAAATVAAMPEAPRFNQGRALYLRHNCLGCHVLDGYPRPAGIGPALTGLAGKSNAAWTRAWMRQPRAYLARTVMPDFELNEEEADAITAYLFTLNQPGTAGPTPPAGQTPAEQGRKKFEDLGCIGCHSLDGADSGFGPDLSRAGEKMQASWLLAWIKDPKQYWPETAMPRMRVSEDEAGLLAAWLATLGATTASDFLAQDVGLVERGKTLARDKGCTGCHKIGEFALGFNTPPHSGIGLKRVDELVFGNSAIPKTLTDWLRLKTRDPRAFHTEAIPTLMPRFGFSDEEAEALTTFLLSLRGRKAPAAYTRLLRDPAAPMVRGELLLERHNCRGCHKIGGEGGVIGPDLGFEGERARPDWLADFLQHPVRIRPREMEPSRMPAFGFSEDEARDLAGYFAAAANTEFPYSRTDKTGSPPEETDEAWRLYFQQFSCQACHAWNGEGGVIGPDQSDLARRLRRDWVFAWLKNPQRFIADIQMPNFELYDDENGKLTRLVMGFTGISPAVREQIRRRWDDEQLARRAAEQLGGR